MYAIGYHTTFVYLVITISCVKIDHGNNIRFRRSCRYIWDTCFWVYDATVAIFAGRQKAAEAHVLCRSRRQ